MLSPTAQRAITAYGGRERWERASALEIVLSAKGWAFRLKLQPPDKRTAARIDIHTPSIHFSLAGQPGNVAVLKDTSVRIESAQGDVLGSRTHPREEFRKIRRLFWWDALDRAYFSGYAIWNYFTLPALLLRKDINWTEISDGLLEARFPTHLPTHSERQQFHFDRETGLLQRHNYTAEVFGNWARASNVVCKHDSFEGIPYPSRRRVTPRSPSGHPLPAPVLVDIKVHEWRLLD